MNDSHRDPAQDAKPGPSLRLFGRRYPLPRSVIVRRVIGVTMVVLGFLGFLPVIGFWMIPLGLLVLSHDSPPIRRLRRQLAVRFGRGVGNERRRE